MTTTNDEKVKEEAIIGAVVGAISGAISGAIAAWLKGKTGNDIWKSAATTAIGGSVTGAIAGAATGANGGEEDVAANVWAATAGSMVKEGAKATIGNQSKQK